MIPQKDPYALENFQNAYDNLAAGKSAQSLTKAQVAEFTLAKKLSPTHYALKIYPRNEEEQWRVEMMKDIQVAYIPFDHVQLTQHEVEELPQAQAKTRSAADTFVEKSPYTVTYEDYETFNGGPTGPVTFQLPILYTVWPTNKPLPDDLEYVVDYEVFLPNTISKTSLSEDAMRILGGEALAFASGSSTQAKVPAIYYWLLKGTAYSRDTSLSSNVMMANLKVKFQNGTFISEATTNSYGEFEILFPALTPSTSFAAIPATLTFTFQDPQGKWKITGSSTNPHTVACDALFVSSPMGPALYAGVELPNGNRQANEIHRAVNYFFNEQTVFLKYSPSGSLRIAAFPGLDPETNDRNLNGQFKFPSNKSPWIEIYNTGFTNSNGDRQPATIGVALHELGHNVYYGNTRSGPYAANFNRVPLLMIESHANYVGWYLGENYYASLGWHRPTANDNRNIDQMDITMNARQKWTVTGLDGPYSPLFVDMADVINQRTQHGGGTAYLQDNLSGMTPANVESIFYSSVSWNDCRAKLQNYANANNIRPQMDIYLLGY